MRVKRLRDSGRRTASRPLFWGLLAATLTIALALALAGCGGGGKGTTTTSATAAPEQTTTTQAAVEDTTTTEAAVEDTTTTEAAVEDTTTTSIGEEVTTTTEKLSTAETRLPNGHIKAMGFIKKVWEQSGKRYIIIDYAEMLTGQEAIDAAVAAGDIQPGEDLPNDYYIRNTNPEKRMFEVSNSVAITTATWDGGSADNPAPISWDVFKSFWSASPPADSSYLRDMPWWIERDGPVVVKIDEQYLP